MNLNLKFYFYSFLIYLVQIIKKEDDLFYGKKIRNTINQSGVKVDLDLLAEIKSQKQERNEQDIFQSINLISINRLVEYKKALRRERGGKSKVKIFDDIMQIINLNIEEDRKLELDK